MNSEATIALLRQLEPGIVGREPILGLLDRIDDAIEEPGAAPLTRRDLANGRAGAVLLPEQPAQDLAGG